MRERVCAVLTAVAVVAVGLAGGVAGRAEAASAVTANAAATDGVAPTEQAALEEARKSGKRVEVSAFRRERRTVFVNPDGTSTAIESVNPVRVYQGGRWAAPDPTLVRGSDGMIRPKAAAVGMRFSGGGAGAFAQMDRAGRKMSLTLPEKLPAPELSGNTATYKEVLPGVDLIVNAEVEGFSHVFRINSADAAKDPRVAKLELGFRTERLKAQPTADGGMDLVDTAAGGAVFEAPQPLMWDSRRPADPPAGGPEGKAPASLDAPNGVELREGPAESSRRAEVRIGHSKNKLVLTPDARLLADPATEFPVFIDPVYKTSSRSGWTMVASGQPTTEYWGFPGKDNEGMGKCPQLSGDPYYCQGIGTKRLFYAIPTSAFKGKTIISAEFAITLRHTYYNAGSNPRTANLRYTSQGISKSTNWSNQPGGLTLLEGKSPTNPTSSCTSTNQNVRFNAKPAVQAGLSTTTFRLGAADEGDYTYWKRWCENAQLEVTYNTPPRAPVQSLLGMSPGGECRSGTGRPYVDTSAPTLQAKANALTDPDHTSAHTELLRAKFKVAWTPAGGTRVEKTLENGNKASGSPFSVALPSTWAIPENTIVTWQVQAGDIRNSAVFSWGPWSGPCEFVVDKTAPKPPVITSIEYPDENHNHDGVGVTGSFTFDSPSTDVVEYRYGFNGDAVQNHVVRPATPGGPVTVQFTPQEAGPQHVTAESVDAAGKSSGDQHDFKVAGGRAPRAHWKLDDDTGSETVKATTTGIPLNLGSDAVPGSPGKNGLSLGLGVTGWSKSNGSTDVPIVRTDQSFTVSTWVTTHNDSNKSIALSQAGSQQSSFELGLEPTNGWVFKMPTTDAPDGGGPWQVAGVGIPVTKDVWTHLVGVYDATAQQLRLYVNGERAAVRDGVTAWNSRGPLQVGRGLYKGTFMGAWTGEIDDVKVLQYAASDAEAQELAADRTPSGRPLLAHWTFDEPAGVRRAYDQSTQVTAAVNGDVVLGGEGRSGNGISLSGSEQYAETGSPIVDPTKSYAVSAWAKPTVNNRWATVAGQEGSRMRAFRIEQISNGNWAMSALPFDTDTDNPVARVQSLQPVRAGEWTHLLGVYDAEAKNIKLYVNGQLQGTATYDAAGWASAPRGPFSIGRGMHQGVKGDYFMGAIDDVRLFDRVVVPQEVHDLFWTAPVRKGYWQLNEAPGGLSPEKSGGKPVAVAGDASIYVNSDPDFGEPALVGAGHLQLNSTGSDGVGTTDSVVRTDGSYTVSVRARLAAAAPDRTMTVVAQAGTSQPGFRLRYNHTNDKWEAGLAAADTPDAAVTWLTYDPEIPSADASGDHLALVYDDFNGEVRLVVNGQEADTAKVSFRSTWNASGQLQVGRLLLGSTPSEYFSGAIDDIRVYSGVVGETPLQNLANPLEQPDL